MAVEHKGSAASPYTLTTTAAQLTTILGITVKNEFGQALPGDQVRTIAFKCPAGNAGTVYISDSSGVTSAGAKATIILAKGEAFTRDEFSGFMNTDEFWIVGSNAGDKLYIDYYV